MQTTEMGEEDKGKRVEDLIRRAHTCWLKIRQAKREADIKEIEEQIEKLGEDADPALLAVIEGLLHGTDLDLISEASQCYNVPALLLGLGLEVD
jgi:hypothetical protein